ncbi:MAG: quinone-dependent dihydroorotate dehydrogenase [Geminicoccaceae bacterium]
MLRLLQRLEPETAHRLAIRGMPFLPAGSTVASPRLRVRFAGLDLPHPVGLAAGFDKNAEAYAAALRLGFGWVEVGTVTPRPQAGNPRPRVFRLVEDRAVINRMGFPNEGLDAAAARLERRDRGAGIVGANIGMNKDAADPAADYLACLRRLYPLADYVTVNVSSPNTPGLRGLQQRAPLTRLLSVLLDARAGLPGPARPLFLKIAPDLDDEAEAAIAEVATTVGVDALIVSNTTVARPADLRSPHKGEAGGLSGRPLLAPATALLARLARRLDGALPLVGVGGIASGADAYARIRAGASAVQLYTALVYGGPWLVRRIAADLDRLLARDGFGSVAAAVGADLA